MVNENINGVKADNAARLEGLTSEIKEILADCDARVAEVWKERDNDLVESVSQTDWEKNVDLVQSCDFIRSKRPYVRRFMGAVNIDVNSFYVEMKNLGPMLLTKLSKSDIDFIFLDKSKTVNESNYQTFFNGYSVDAYGIKNSLGLIRTDDGVCYAYLPVMSKNLMISQAEIVSAMEKAKMHISSMYMPVDFELFSWYKLTENNQKKNKHSMEYYEEKVNEIKAGYKEQVEEKVAMLVKIYDGLKTAYPLGENLGDLLKRDISAMPDTIAFGSCSVETSAGKARIPQLRKFPLTNAMWFKEKDIPNLHALYLRLLCSLPIGKIQFTVFDPNGLGEHVNDFNMLFSTPELFPAKRILSFKQELKDELVKALEYVRHIRQDIFDKECSDWVTYNQKMSLENSKKMLPYKVFTFFDVPDEMDTEALDMLEKLIRHGKDCGFLVLFSYLERPEKSSEEKWNVLEECVANTKNLSEELNGPDERTKNIKDSIHYPIEFIDERIMDKAGLSTLLRQYFEKLVAENVGVKFDFAQTIDVKNLFGCDSHNGLEFTIGYDETTEEPVKMKIDNEATHYLIGGTTGSGKSNLLHNLIMSACARYSPKELQIYLMDFKEGVEFSTYARPILPHARLVAMEADTEYGVNVLDHLTQVNKSRYQKFKEKECTNISTYRTQNPNEIMPRILVIVDEFQVLFEGPDKVKTTEKLKNLAKQGRACGIHLVMATQTLSGLDFGPLESQFAGRIVLKCSAEDSKRLLGGISSNNEAASELKIPYAIVNTSNGHVYGNIKISVPYADPDVIRESIKTMCANPQGKPIGKVNVFEGQTLPKHPEAEAFESANAEVILGKEMSFKADRFSIELQGKETDNILGVVSDDVIKQNLVLSMKMSVASSEEFDEFVYIGTDKKLLQWEVDENTKIFKHVLEFLEYIGEEMFDTRRLVVFDNCNLAKEVAFPTGYGAIPTGDAKKVMDYLQEASSNYSCCVALYNRIFNMKNGKMPLEAFDHRIGYGLNDDDTRALVGNMSLGKNDRITNRCFYAENASIVGWFQPFVTPEEE
ncbi:MAG: DNA translocase FtsK [Lachnospiraceae bacterium]|nr:DNA translocase FtsK [Lachnospiraceae bacterium]